MRYKFIIQKTLFYLILISFCVPTSAQRKYAVSDNRNVHLTPPGKKIEATIHIKEKPRADPDKMYFWYSNETIQQTQGGYSGYLLNGPYTEFSYPDHHMLIQGSFRKGLKHGRWTYWYPNNHIKESIEWNKGRLHGDKNVYNIDGSLLQVDRYKKNKLISTYYVAADSTVKYGTPNKIIKATGRLWHNVTNVFRRKKKD